MKRSANTHIILKDMLIVGGIGVSIYLYSVIYDLNFIMDKSEPKLQKAFIENMREVRTTGKSSRTYYQFHLYPSSKLSTKTLNVDFALFNTARINDCLEIKTKSGFFGAEWIYQINKSNNCNSVH